MRPTFRPLLFAMFGLCAVPAQGADLVDVYLLSLQSNAEFRAAQAELRAQSEARPQARARILPSLSASAGYSETSQDREGTAVEFVTAESYDFTTGTYSLNLSQVLYNRAVFAQLDQASAQVAQAEAQFGFAHQNLILTVSEAYFNVLAAEDNLAFAEAERKAIAQQLEQARQRFEVGLTAITDVREAQARHDQAVAQEIAAENQLNIAEEVMREVTGQAFETLAELQTEMPLVRPDPAEITEWVERALEQNLQLIAARRGAEVVRGDVRVAESARYPSVDIVASHSYRDSNSPQALFIGRETTDNTVGLQLNLRLFEGGALGSRTRQAGFLFEQATESVEQQRRATERQARSAYLNVLSGISQVNALEQALESASTALDATQAGFEVGTRTAVEVLNSQRAVFLARRDLARSRYDYVLDTLRLKQAAGTLSEEDVVLVNRWLLAPAASTSPTAAD